MIDLHELREIHEKVMDDEISAIRERKLLSLDDYDEDRQKEFKKLESAKKRAYEQLPASLLDVETQIKQRAELGDRKLIYGIPESYDGMFSAILLLEVLTVNELVCKIRNNTLEIRW